MAWFVYVAQCGDDSLYTGITTDPARREAAHNSGRGAAYTRARGPVRLVYLEPARDRGAALRRELVIKRLSRTQKERLLARGPAFSGFRPEALRFLRGLARHNTREWFERHRAVYETELRDPLRRLVEEMDVRLAGIAPELVGDPRRSIFRIHRDVRFSPDKSPYKTNAACQFYHRDAGRGAGQDAEGAGAGLYFQLAEGDCFVAGGIWMPARPALDQEEVLKRVPRGFPADHPAERWLRFRSFTAARELAPAEVTSPRLPAILARDFATLVPLVRWLNAAIGYQPAERRF